MCSPRHIGHSWWLAVCSSAHRSGRQSGSLRWSYLSYWANIHLHARAGGEAHFIDIRDSAASRHLETSNKENFIFHQEYYSHYAIYDIRYSQLESTDKSIETLLCCKQCLFLFETSPVHWEFHRGYVYYLLHHDAKTTQPLPTVFLELFTNPRLAIFISTRRRLLLHFLERNCVAKLQ